MSQFSCLDLVADLHGAPDNGTTDNWALVAAALPDLVDGGAVVIPPAERGAWYGARTNLIFPVDRQMRLTGVGGAIVSWLGVGSMIALPTDPNAVQSYKHEIDHLRLYAGAYDPNDVNATGQGTCVDIQGSIGNHLHHLTISGFGAATVTENVAGANVYAEQNKQSDIDIYKCQIGALFTPSGGAGAFSTTSLTRWRFNSGFGAGSIGINVVAGAGLRRSYFECQIFADQPNSIGFKSDCSMPGAAGHINVEMPANYDGQNGLWLGPDFDFTAPVSITSLLAGFPPQTGVNSFMSSPQTNGGLPPGWTAWGG